MASWYPTDLKGQVRPLGQNSAAHAWALGPRRLKTAGAASIETLIQVDPSRPSKS